MKPKQPNVSVCVPTFKRPTMLASCLKALCDQHAVDFTFSIVVVDNDAGGSARMVADDCQRSSMVDIRYLVEEVANISLARNAAVRAASGEYVAFIDDDEVPDGHWLASLLETCQRYDADGVLGPVLPHYEGSPPGWLVRSGLCVRPSFPTGTSLRDPKYMRTGNVLLRSAIFDGQDEPFAPRLGRSGGEDADFFGRMLERSHAFVWCDEARVYEAVPHERQSLKYHVRRAFIRGMTEAEKTRLISYGTLKSTAAITLYGIALPVLAAVSYHRFARTLVKCCDHLAKVLGLFGVRPVRERTL